MPFTFVCLRNKMILVTFLVTFTAGQKKGVESLRNAHLTPEYKNMMFGACLGVLGSSEKEWGLHPKNEVEVEPTTKMADFSRILAFFSQNVGVLPF